MNTNQEELAKIWFIYHNLTMILASHIFFMSIGMNAFEQNFQLNHFDCENDFAFRKSACNMQPPENQNKF